MPDVTLTIDGKEITVPQGTGTVEAARAAGIEIPVFCHHPKLQPVGMCRMCLVEVGTPKMDPATKKPMIGEDGKPVIAMMPNLQVACTNPVSNGMVVKTNTAEVEFARKGVLEFLLTSHPLDCPVCIKGGECPLQNLTMGYGPGVSRFDYADKVHFQKPISLSPLIDLDRERCILCSRCVRFEDEIAGDAVLGFANRGRGWMIQSKSNPSFNSKFSGNTVDICPVGALMSHDFRFAGRVWEVKPVPSICPHCPVGCNVTLDMRYRDIKRVQPRENDWVNEIWLCDRGRYGYHFVDSPKRLTKPLVRRNGVLVETTWAAALEEIAQRLAGINRGYPGTVVGGIASGRLANEDLYLFQKLFRDLLKSSNLDCRTGAPEEAEHDDLAYAFGLGSGSDLSKLGKGTSVLVLGADPEEEAPVYVLRLRGIKRRGGELIVANGRATKLDASATHTARFRYGFEALFMFGVLSALLEAGAENKTFSGERVKNLGMLRQALEPYNVGAVAQQIGVSEETIRGVATSVAGAENLIVMYGREAIAAGTPLLQAIGNLLLVTGHVGKANNGALPLLRYNNSRGALDMGVRPDKGPGYTPLPQAGMTAREMIAGAVSGKLRALYLVGSDPAAAYPQAAAALGKLDLLIVQELFMTASAEQAHFVLPAASFAERDGTYTNSERRVQRFRQARDAVGESRPDWQIFATLGRELAKLLPQEQMTQVGKASAKPAAKGQAKVVTQAAPGPRPWVYRSSDDVHAEIIQNVGIYAGLSYSALRGQAGGVWGRQATHDAIFYDGTSYANTEGVGAQWPALAEQSRLAFDLVFSKPTPVVADGQQFTLVAAARLYDDGTLMQPSELLRFWVAQPYVGLSQPDAQRLGVESGDKVRLTSQAGQLELFARVDREVGVGIALVPDLETIPLAAVQTGVVTPVRIEKVA
ncbi:MAG: NADH-quinone oxidoreductase subunit NuoG [Herpetosiphonaceae bacterium]|nr:NADH-quinone oxidoreductase subunit NuoG [Herpetosiphonaceae bacterium]